MTFSLATAQHTIKVKLFEAALALYDPATVNVSFGASTSRGDLRDYVEFHEIDTDQEPGPISGTNRSRDETVEVNASFAAFRAGTDPALGDKPVADAATALVTTLERHIRQTDPTLGGTCLWCFAVSSSTRGATDKALLAKGRLIQIDVTFRARVRITG